MNTRTLQAAITEAERFLDLARELQAEQFARARHPNVKTIAVGVKPV